MNYIDIMKMVQYISILVALISFCLSLVALYLNWRQAQATKYVKLIYDLMVKESKRGKK